MLGVYVHIPFCDNKCPYCDFYSQWGDEELKDRYVEALKGAIADFYRANGRKAAETVYFGGGTPSTLGAQRLSALLRQIEASFYLPPAAEITLEVNPTGVDAEFFQEVRTAGFNRLSMGIQSANEGELRFLGRKHSAKDAASAVENARKAGFQNISLDLMLGLPGGSKEKLLRSVQFCADLQIEHISAYILKIEPNTPFGRQNVKLPEDDSVADQYLFCVEKLEKRGYHQYEISNFARPGFESRHNLIYWHDEEYLGFGPGAHSFFGGRRFFYPRDLMGFLAGNVPVQDGEGGGFEEYAMLNLRLAEGLTRERCQKRFGELGIQEFERVLEKAKKFPPQLVRAGSEKISFTSEGFLVSNALLAELLMEE